MPERIHSVPELRDRLFAIAAFSLILGTLPSDGASAVPAPTLPPRLS
ncbi:MAG: hypothetical protein HDR49_02090 [Bacteroides sp.]|nr:hypothetical protein [Bacteroides sp.]MBD5421803.1 hypothetical protein [Bacteroides sp.]